MFERPLSPNDLFYVEIFSKGSFSASSSRHVRFKVLLGEQFRDWKTNTLNWSRLKGKSEIQSDASFTCFEKIFPNMLVRGHCLHTKQLSWSCTDFATTFLLVLSPVWKFCFVWFVFYIAIYSALLYMKKLRNKSLSLPSFQCFQQRAPDVTLSKLWIWKFRPFHWYFLHDFTFFWYRYALK